MRRFLHWCLVLGLAPWLIFSCSRSEEAPAGPADLPKEPEIRISGSGTLFPVLRRLVDAYAAENPRLKVHILPGTSTAGGVAGVRSGALQIGLASRRLTRDEARGVAYHLIGYDPIAFAVHPSCGVPRLTGEDVRRIYAGRVTRWSELHGSPRDILVLDREEGESLRLTLVRHFFEPGFRVTSSAVVLQHAEDMVRALDTTPFTIGYAGRGELRAAGLGVILVPPLGRWPRADEVRSRTYSLVIPLGLVTAPSPRPEVVRFLEFLAGPRAAAVLDALGCTPAGG